MRLGHKLLIIALLLCPSWANAAITHVQSAQNQDASAGGASTGVSVPFSGNNTAGCMLFVTQTILFAGAPSVNSMLPTPTDTAGDVFVLVSFSYAYNPTSTAVAAWMVSSCVGGANTVMFSNASSFGVNATISEYSGTGITLDQRNVWPCGSSSNAGVANVLSTPPMYTSSTAEMVIAWGYDERELVTLATDNSFTIRAQGGGGIFDLAGSLAVADRSVSSRGTYSTTFSGATNARFRYAGAASFSEGGSVIVPPIEQVACGDALQAWHEMGTFTTLDILLDRQVAGDYLFCGYRADPGIGTPTISNANGYSWTSIQSSANFNLWYAIVPSTVVAGDVVTYGNINNNNAGRCVELHGLSALPNLVSSSGNSASFTLTLGGYTTPAYCTRTVGACAVADLWYATMLDTRRLIGDFLIFANSDGQWLAGTIPGTTPSPGTVGTDLFPTDLHYLEVWLPGAPALPTALHAAQEY